MEVNTEHAVVREVTSEQTPERRRDVMGRALEAAEGAASAKVLRQGRSLGVCGTVRGCQVTSGDGKEKGWGGKTRAVHRCQAGAYGKGKECHQGQESLCSHWKGPRSLGAAVGDTRGTREVSDRGCWWQPTPLPSCSAWFCCDPPCTLFGKANLELSQLDEKKTKLNQNEQKI